MKKLLCVLALILTFLVVVAAVTKPEKTTLSQPVLTEDATWEPVYDTRYYFVVIGHKPFMRSSWEEDYTPKDGSLVLFSYSRVEVRYDRFR